MVRVSQMIGSRRRPEEVVITEKSRQQCATLEKRKVGCKMQKRINSHQPMKNIMYLWTTLKKDVVNIQADLLKLPHGDGNEYCG